MKRLKQDGRGIVLMHDIQTRTVKMLPRLLRSLKKEGYRIVHVVPATRGTKPVEPMVVASTLPVARPEQGRAARSDCDRSDADSRTSADPPVLGAGTHLCCSRSNHERPRRRFLPIHRCRSAAMSRWRARTS